jgi:RNA polymerase sigma-70 factor (ECF subfamily)
VQDERSDESLLRAHNSGDPQSLAVLLKRYEGWHRGIARKRFGANDELVADAVQEAWLGIYRKAETFRGEAKVSTWMYRIVDNACIDLLRKEMVRPQLHLMSDQIQESIPDEQRFEEQSDAQITVFGALFKLPDEQRDAILLTDIEGFSEEDAAKKLGVAPGTIKSRRSRGRAKLAELLADLSPNRMEPTPPAARHIDGGE